jgi:hypothetical protein
MIEVHKIPSRSMAIKIVNDEAGTIDFALLHIEGVTAHLQGWNREDPTWEVASVIQSLYPQLEFVSWYRTGGGRLVPMIKRLTAFDA